ncbi:MAG TPA: BTAD domain-containing putative transcriptional regulator [Dermatophilaceae bacterium]|nr:BTAD domain-containing putative transcriptional regulator [Dermatophilaceae bacterium]
MGIAVLGPLEVDGTPSSLGLRDRVVLQALAVSPGVPVSADALAEAIWGEDLPASWAKVVQGCVVRIRKALGADSIETSPQGYRLVHHADHIDHLKFGRLLERARELVAAREPERAAYVLREALALWRGEPFAELVEWQPGRVATERLVELRLEAEDLLTEAELLAGHHRAALAPAQRMVREAPLRERRWGLLALALYQDGRQAEALQTLKRARRVLLDELGLDPGPDLVTLEEAILHQDPSLAVAATITQPSTECPYPGLVAYDIEDAATFYGREEVTASCLRRLDESRVLAVVGPSGCGKSSLVRAGVAAALERDGLRVYVVAPGSHPMSAMTAVPRHPGTVLVVDQCEEALALDEGSPERTEFFEALVEFAQRHHLVVTMRADRIGELSPHPGFARLVEGGLYLLGPMTEPDLRRAIEGPAAQAGLRLEPGLVDLLVREVAGEPAALPLLSHVLRQTWRLREGDTLTVEGYAATGGVREAVAQSAEGVFRGLDAQQQEMLRELMLRLVAPDEGGDPVRTRVPRRSVAGDDAHARLVEQLLGARLLVSDGDTVEIAHESLAVAWPRLRSWLDEDVDGLRIMRHLSVAAESWDELGRPDSELYRGVRQARASEWYSRTQASLTGAELEFLGASAALADKEQRTAEAQVRRERRLNQRLRAGLAAVAALLAVALVAGALALTAADRADQEAAAAAHQARAADARRLGAEALRSEDLDRSLLLAAAGVTLDNSVDTRNYLLATLARGPSLVGSARSAGRILSLGVNNATGQVATMVADDVGLELFDGQTLRRVSPPEKVRGVAVVPSPDGQRYAVSMWADLVEDGVEPPVVLLDRTGARSAVQLGGFPSGFHVFDNMGFSPNGRWLAVFLHHLKGEKPSVMAVWDLSTPSRPVASFPLRDGGTPTVSSDGRTLYSTGADGGPLRVTDLRSGKMRRIVGPGDLGVRQIDQVLAQSPDGRTLAVGAGVEAVLLEASTLRPRAFLSGQGSTSGLAFSPDGTHVAASGDRLTVWDIRGADPVEVLEQDSSAGHPRFSRDGKTLYTATLAGLVQAWDLAGDRRFITAQPGASLGWDMAVNRISPDRRKVAYVTTGPRFRVRDVATGKLGPVVAPEMEQREFIDIAWHPDSTTLNITTGAPVVRTWDSTTGRQLAEHRLGPPGTSEGASIAFFSVDGRFLLVGTTTGRLHVLDARTLDPVREPIQVYRQQGGEPNPREIPGLTPSGDLHTAYLSDAIVDYRAGTVRPIPDLGFPVINLFPSPDGKRLLVNTGDTGVGLVDAATMQWISRPNAVQAGLVGYMSVFSDDGSLVASVNESRLSYWDGRTGAYLGTVTVYEDGAPSFSKDNTQLLFAGAGGSVLTWNLDPRSWVATACRLAGRPLTEQEWRNYLPDRPFVPVCAS